MIYLTNFPNNNEEIELIKFISNYQYLNVNDAKYFFNTKTYYTKRLTNLVKKKYLRRTNLNLVLDELGVEYVKAFNFKYNRLNRNRKYYPRLLYISSLGAYYHKCNTVNFTPSFDIKEKGVFTIKGRRFIGILEINGIDYLTYYITEKHNKGYIASIMYDIQKEKKYKNIIILINDIDRININEFATGMNKILLVEDNDNNREKIKYLHSINWYRIIKDKYKNKMFLSEYNFCDYTDNKSKYIAYFYFLDTEKINRIKYFLRENKNKNADIICSKELEPKIKKELPNCNYIIVDLEDYIDKERNIYD